MWAFTCEQVHLFLSRGYDSPREAATHPSASAPVSAEMFAFTSGCRPSSRCQEARTASAKQPGCPEALGLLMLGEFLTLSRSRLSFFLEEKQKPQSPENSPS